MRATSVADRAQAPAVSCRQFHFPCSCLLRFDKIMRTCYGNTITTQLQHLPPSNHSDLRHKKGPWSSAEDRIGCESWNLTNPSLWPQECSAAQPRWPLPAKIFPCKKSHTFQATNLVAGWRHLTALGHVHNTHLGQTMYVGIHLADSGNTCIHSY